MKVNGIESRSIRIDVDQIEMIDALKRDWLLFAVGHDDACPREGQWYHNFASAHPDYGSPGDGIRELTWGESEMYYGLQALKSFYQDKINKDWEKQRAREAKWGADLEDV